MFQGHQHRDDTMPLSFYIRMKFFRTTAQLVDDENALMEREKG